LDSSSSAIALSIGAVPFGQRVTTV